MSEALDYLFERYLPPSRLFDVGDKVLIPSGARGEIYRVHKEPWGAKRFLVRGRDTNRGQLWVATFARHELKRIESEPSQKEVVLYGEQISA